MSRGQCVLCGDVVESKHRHDFVRCGCGESFLDGGDDSPRGSLSMVPVDETPMSDVELLNYLETLGEGGK